MATDSSETRPVELSVNPTVIDFILLDEQLATGHRLEDTWRDALKTKDLNPLIHGALVYINDNYPGAGGDALAKATGFREGVAFVLESLIQSAEAERQDATLFEG